MPTPWQAFLDESGQFERPDDRVVLAAVLCRGGRPQAGLRQDLCTALPGVPWPPHAAHLAHPMYRPAALLVDPAERRRAPEVVLRGADWLASADLPAAEAVRRDALACRDGRKRWLDLALLRAAEKALAGCDAVLVDRLWEVRVDQDRALRDAFGRRRGEYHVVAAWQGPQPAVPTGPARYAALLACVEERIAHLVGEGQVLAIRPSARHDSPRIAAQGPRQVHGVAVTHGNPVPYDAQVHPAFVLADVVANRLRSILDRGSWPVAVGRWSCDLPLEMVPSFGTEPLPAVAVEGPERKVVLDAMAGKPKAPLRATLTRVGRWWPHDQAAAWVEAAP